MPSVPVLTRHRFVVICCVALITPCSRRQSEFQRARELEQQEKWQEAVVSYNRVLGQVTSSQQTQLAGIYGRLGHCLIELGRGTDALIFLEKAFALDANNVNAHLRMAQLFVAADAPQQAEPHIAYVAAFSPDDPEMLQVRAAMYTAEGHNDIAERDLLRAYDLSKDGARVAERLAQLYLGENRADKARAILAHAAGRSPRKLRLLLTLARLEETEGETAAAEYTYRNALAIEESAENNRRFAQFLARNGKVGEAEEILRKVDAKQLGSPTDAADLLLQAGRPREALRDYEFTYGRLVGSVSLKDRGCSWTRTRARNLAVRMIEADLVLAASGDSRGLSAARVHFAQASGDLDAPSRSLVEAEIDLASGDLPTADRNANEALKTAESQAPAQYLLGAIAARRGQQTDARNHWRSALHVNANYVPARLMLAADAIGQRDGSKAEEYIVDVVREEPANVDSLLLYARALLLQARYDSARALCQRILAVDRNNAQASIVLGDIALQQHQLAMALLEYEKAILLDPHSKEAIEGLTAVYKEGGASRVMLRRLESLGQSGTSSSRLMEIAGRLYASQQMYPDAIRCLKRAVEMDPSRQSATVALANAYAHGESVNAGEMLARSDLKGLSGMEQPAASSSLIAALRAEKRSDQSEAERQYESAVRAGDPSGIASNNLAWIYAVRGVHLDRALQLAQHALEMNPGSPQVLDTLGVLQVENRQFSQAIRSFQSGARRASELKAMAELQHTIEAHLTEARQMAGQPRHGSLTTVPPRAMRGL